MPAARFTPFVLVGFLLMGCPVVTSSGYDEIRDQDGDGGIATRFGGPDCLDDDPSVADCDIDGDGALSLVGGGDDCDDQRFDVNPSAVEVCDGVDNNCDGLVDANDPSTLDTVPGFADLDGDGFGGTDQRPVCPDAVPGGRVLVGGDCDDAQASIHPGAAEFCDTVDRDCDGETFDVDANDAVASRTIDADEDGFGTGVLLGPGCVTAGLLDAAFAPPSLDCDDTDPAAYPGATEIPYDGIDQACDGAVGEDDADGDGFAVLDDCNDNDAAVFPGAIERCDGIDNDCDGAVDSDDPSVLDPSYTYLRDGDGDGFGNAAQVRGFCPGDDTTGWVLNLGVTDCDDAVATSHPFATELCDGLDNDCNGTADDNAANAGTFYVDLDGDGFGSTVTRACSAGPQVAALGGDCDDTVSTTYPGATEVCGDGVLQDCLRPERRTDCDLDGGIDVLVGGTDCDDGNPTVLAGATEICDGFDNDCDGVVDVGATDATVYYRDADGDGFGATEVRSCTASPGLVVVAGDCDDTVSTTFPGAFETCGDGVLQDCDEPSQANDCDGDGEDDEAFGGTDCDDTDPTVFAAASEVCDGADNDCDGLVDDNDPNVDLSTSTDWYQDLDGDGFGSLIVVALNTCSRPPGGVVASTDCDDLDATQAPNLPEVCDGNDNDCDGLIDDSPTNAPTFHLDTDGDGFGDPSVRSTSTCAAPAPPVTGGTWLLDGTDCDDDDLLVNPDATELCDGFDNDCDQSIDDGDAGDGGSFAPLTWYLDSDGDGVGQPGAITLQCVQPLGHVTIAGDCDDDDVAVTIGQTWYADVDGDGYGDAAVSLTQCGQPANHVATATDCNDALANVSPAALEVCDGVDNDCDGLLDDDDPGTLGVIPVFTDTDGDGFGAAGSLQLVCGVPPNTTFVDGDCDDTDPLVALLQPYWPDADRDGYGLDSVLPTLLCPTDPLVTSPATPPLTLAPRPGDCNDAPGMFGFGSGAFENPDVPEICDGLDNDCDGLIDDNDPDRLESSAQVRYRDQDGDGYGDPQHPTYSCFAFPGDYVTNAQDCNDSGGPFGASSYQWFGAPEFCDGIDNDCDGLLDEADPDSTDVTVLAADITNTFDQPFAFAQALGEICDGATLHLGAGVHFLDDYAGPRLDKNVTLVGATDLTGAPLAQLVRWNDPMSREEPLLWIETTGTVRIENLDVDCTVPGVATAYAGPGAGLLVDTGATVELENVHFANCLGTAGGAIAARGGSSLLLERVTIDDSTTSSGNGGAIWIEDSEAVLIEVETHNTVASFGSGGALAIEGASDVYASGLTIQGASAFSRGGGVYVGAGARFEAEFMALDTTQSENGGGIDAFGAEIVLRDAYLIATTAADTGGGVAATASDLDFERVTLLGASAMNGGAIDLFSSSWTDADGRYEGNTAVAGGSSFQLDDSTVDVVGSGFFEQVASSGTPWFAASQSDIDFDRTAFVRSTGSLQVQDGSLNLRRSRILDTDANASVECIGSADCAIRTTVFAGRAGSTQHGLFANTSTNVTLDFNDWVGHGAEAIVVSAGNARCFEVSNLFHDNGGLTQVAVGVNYSITNRVTIDPEYAAFDKDFLAYENALFLPQASGALAVGSMAGAPPQRAAWESDVDGDGLPDAFELLACNNVVACNANDDPDGDGSSNLAEAMAFSNPLAPDTDGDGFIDGVDAAPVDPNAQ